MADVASLLQRGCRGDCNMTPWMAVLAWLQDKETAAQKVPRCLL